MTEIKTLTRRELTANPTTLTSNEFVDMIMQDIETAKKTYFEMTSKDAEARYERDKKLYLDKREKDIAQIIEASYKKYTKEFYRKRWVEKQLEKFPEEYKRNFWHEPKELTYIDWSMKPWENGTSCISFDRGEEQVRKFFERVFEADFNNKYFSQCMGWEIVVNYRPSVKLILSEELEAQWKEDERKLGEAISRFYRGSKYWGD